MRPSRVLRKLRAGQIVGCTKLNLGDPRAADIAAASGIDCIWVCREHVPNDLREIEAAIRAAKAYDVDTLVRVPRGSYSDLVHPLEMDAAGIMVPHVMSAADALQTARQTRFHPIGRRALDGGNADGAYCRIPVRDYIEQANRERFVIVQIEDPEPLEELDAIAAVEGIDMLFFGPGDFSHAIGCAGELNAPPVVEARRRIAAAARRHGKFAGTVGSTETIASLVDLGYQFINIGADVTMLTSGFGHVAQAFSAWQEHKVGLGTDGVIP
jgi:4-hydroxy-2-oxoheptanedioate aldolase